MYVKMSFELISVNFECLYYYLDSLNGGLVDGRQPFFDLQVFFYSECTPRTEGMTGEDEDQTCDSRK